MVFIKKILVFFLSCFSLISCAWFSDTNSIKLKPKIFQTEIGEPAVQLIDVRTPEEYFEFHIQGALNINCFSENFEDSLLVLDNKKPVYIYCRSGKRSNKSVSKFKKAGFDSIYELDGGILNWKNKGLEIIKK